MLLLLSCGGNVGVIYGGNNLQVLEESNVAHGSITVWVGKVGRVCGCYGGGRILW